MRLYAGSVLLALGIWFSATVSAEELVKLDKVPITVKKATKRGTLPLKVEGNTVVVVKSMPCDVIAPAGADFYIWTFPDNVKGTADEHVFHVTAAPKGESSLSVIAVTIDFSVDKDGKVKKEVKRETGSIILTVGFAPDPKPDPTPDPTPDPAPVVTDKLAVLIVEETENRTELPKAQLEIITSVPFRDWVKSKVGKDDKGQPLFRVYDPSTDMTGEAKLWQDAMKVERESQPWLLVSNGKSGYSGPLPANVTAAKALIAKYVITPDKK